MGHWPFCGSKTGEFGVGAVAAFIVGWLTCEVEAVGCSEFLVLFPRSEVSFENFFIFRFLKS